MFVGRTLLTVNSQYFHILAIDCVLQRRINIDCDVEIEFLERLFIAGYSCINCIK